MTNLEEASKRLSKVTSDLMRHPETRAYIGVFMMGKVSIEESIPTACTDGINEKYNPDFLMKLSLPEARGLKMHEGLHKVFKHTVRCLSFWKEDPKLANQAADYVVNDLIMNVADKAFIKLPAGGLYDPKFHGWAFPEIFNFLKQEKQGGKGGGGSGRGEPLDEHDMSGAEQMSAEEIKEYAEKINEALHQGSMLASRLGKTLPRAVTDDMQPQVDWRDTLHEFVNSVANGNDEHTYRRFDKKMMAYDIIQPGVYSEKVGDIIVAIDVSGSINQEQINEFAAELQSICEQVSPDALRVIWWHDRIDSEQLFMPEQFGDIRKLLKPNGSGGTYVTCVSDYITKQQLKADCVLVFTDGFVEYDPKWDVTVPTLWLVTRRQDFVPPRGMTVKIN